MMYELMTMEEVFLVTYIGTTLLAFLIATFIYCILKIGKKSKNIEEN